MIFKTVFVLPLKQPTAQQRLGKMFGNVPKAVAVKQGSLLMELCLKKVA
jgi:hypothetical protein